MYHLSANNLQASLLSPSIIRSSSSTVMRCAAVFLTLLFSMASHAVHIAPSGHGEALIIPIYTTAGQFDTLLEISNTRESSEHATALKINLVSAEGEVKTTLNVYLDAFGTWAMGLAGTSDGTTVGTVVAGCTLAVNADGKLSAVDSFSLGDTSSGYIEIVEMGVLTDTDLRTALDDQDCAAFVEYWDDVIVADGNPDDVLGPPMGAVRATASLINVDRGTMYSVNATALTNFRTREWHSPPTAIKPDLSSAYNAPAVTTSSNCYVTPCLIDEWDNPVDAVSAALMTRTMTGGLVISESMGARTEWVLTAPLLRFREEKDSTDSFENVAFFLYFDRNGWALPGIQVPTPPPPFGEFSHNDMIDIDHAVLSLPIGPMDGNPSDARILDLSSGMGESSFDTGSVRVGFGGINSPLQSPSGREYRGHAVIGLVLQEFNNEYLPGEDGRKRVASYGNILLPTYSMEYIE